MENTEFGARLNSFKLGLSKTEIEEVGNLTLALLRRASKAGLTCADLNFPDHLSNLEIKQLKNFLKNNIIKINGLAMRYYTSPKFKLGAFTNPEKAVRRLAIDETKKGLDLAASLDCKTMTLWMGQDGLDYSFQADFSKMWDDTIMAMQELADHNQNINISIEYKPNEPRAFSLMPDVATTLLALAEINRANTGVTLDFAHVLYADEMPAFAANLINRKSKLLGVHLNDGYGKWDNGLMVGSVHPIQTLELLVELLECNYDGAIYFDTFPDHSGLDPIEESRENIAITKKLIKIAQGLHKSDAVQEARTMQNPILAQQIIRRSLFK
jgi:xylose isomerase